METEVWHPRTTPDDPGSIVLDVPRVFFQMCQIEIQDAGLSWLLEPHEHRTLWYEDGLESPEHHQPTVDEICRTLGIDPHRVSSKLQKSPEATVAVANLDEIKEHVKQTRFANYVD
jgi:hypothetical protein